MLQEERITTPATTESADPDLRRKSTGSSTPENARKAATYAKKRKNPEISAPVARQPRRAGGLSAPPTEPDCDNPPTAVTAPRRTTSSTGSGSTFSSERGLTYQPSLVSSRNGATSESNPFT